MTQGSHQKKGDDEASNPAFNTNANALPSEEDTRRPCLRHRRTLSHPCAKSLQMWTRAL